MSYTKVPCQQERHSSCCAGGGGLDAMVLRHGSCTPLWQNEVEGVPLLVPVLDAKRVALCFMLCGACFPWWRCEPTLLYLWTAVVDRRH